MFKKGSVITCIFIINTIFSLVSQIVVTRIFGAKFDLDIFLAAVSIPTILVTIIYSTLNDAFLPLFGEYKTKHPEKEQSYFLSHLLVLTFISLVCVLIVGFFTQPLSYLLYGNRGEVFVKEVSTQLLYMLYSVPIAVVATLLGSYFYAHKQFIRFPLAQAIGSIANIGMILLLAPSMGIWSLVIAFVANIFVQILFVIPPASFWNNINNNETFSSLKNFGSIFDIIPFFIAWLPLLIGSFALRSDTLLIRSFGTNLPEGYLVYLNLIAKMFSLATGVMTIGIQVLLLPHLVEYFAQKEYSKAIATINKAKIFTIGISVLVTIGLMLFAPLLIHLLFVGGKFTAKDAEVAISLLPMFVLPAIGWGINSIFFQPLLALKKQLQLGILYVLSLVFGWIAATIIQTYFGALPAITGGLIVLLFTGIIGSEILWQYYKKNLTSLASSS